MSSINWADLTARADEAEKPLSEGEHRFRVTTATATETKNGDPMISLVLHCIGDDPQAGKSVFCNMAIGAKDIQLVFFFRNLESFGITKEFVKENSPSFEDLAKILEGKEIGASIKHRKYNGAITANVEYFIPDENQEPIEMPEQETEGEEFAF